MFGEINDYSVFFVKDGKKYVLYSDSEVFHNKESCQEQQAVVNFMEHVKPNEVNVVLGKFVLKIKSSSLIKIRADGGDAKDRQRSPSDRGSRSSSDSLYESDSSEKGEKKETKEDCHKSPSPSGTIKKLPPAPKKPRKSRRKVRLTPNKPSLVKPVDTQSGGSTYELFYKHQKVKMFNRVTKEIREGTLDEAIIFLIPELKLLGIKEKHYRSYVRKLCFLVPGKIGDWDVWFEEDYNAEKDKPEKKEKKEK